MALEKQAEHWLQKLVKDVDAEVREMTLLEGPVGFTLMSPEPTSTTSALIKVKVEQVDYGGAAWQAGVLPGDALISVDNVTISSVQEAMQRIEKARPVKLLFQPMSTAAPLSLSTPSGTIENHNNLEALAIEGLPATLSDLSDQNASKDSDAEMMESGEVLWQTFATRSCQVCQEQKSRCPRNWPKCESCTKRNLSCDYPPDTEETTQPPPPPVVREVKKETETADILTSTVKGMLSDRACKPCSHGKARCSRHLPRCERCAKTERVCTYPVVAKPPLPVSRRVPSPAAPKDGSISLDSCEICKLSGLDKVFNCCMQCLSAAENIQQNMKKLGRANAEIDELKEKLQQERQKTAKLEVRVKELETQLCIQHDPGSPIGRPVFHAGIKQKSNSKKKKGGAASTLYIFGPEPLQAQAATNSTSRGRRTKRPKKFTEDELVDWGSTDKSSYKKATRTPSEKLYPAGKYFSPKMGQPTVNQRYILENVPFLGWKRELVYRSTGNKQADIYFHPPHAGRKLRSRPDILRHYSALGVDAQPFIQYFNFVNVWCVCHTRDYQSDEVIQCSCGAGGCNGYVHAKCVGLESLSAVECAEMSDFKCKLCEEFTSSVLPKIPTPIRENHPPRQLAKLGSVAGKSRESTNPQHGSEEGNIIMKAVSLNDESQPYFV